MTLKQATLAVFGLAAIVHLSGCATAEANRVSSSQSGAGGQDDTYIRQLEAERKRAASLEQELRAKDAELQAAQTQIAQGMTPAAGGAASQAGMAASLFPPNPKAGECYARVLIPAKFDTATQTVLKREASERIEIVPAQYETVQERVLVKEASTKLEIVPAVYEDLQERVLIKPASTKLVEIPATYKTVSERVLVKPAHTIWKRGPASAQKGNVVSESVSDTGELMCLVEVPASYKNVERQVLVTPARTDTVTIPAEYETVTKRVIKTPPTTREITIPAEYTTVTATKLVREAQERRIDIPAQYTTVTERKKIAEERVEWRSVLCEVNMTRDKIIALQRALESKGYYKGPIDGIIGPQTLAAASAYAKRRNLPYGSSYITMEVIKDLGLAERIAGLM